MIELLRTRSLSLAVQEEIERMALSGELRAGDRLNENLLASRLGISRGPIREACRALIATGLLEAQVNRGVFVRRLSIEDALEIYDIRASLEALACRRVALRVTPVLLDELRRLIDEMAACAEAQDRSSYNPLNTAFHETIFAACGNERLARLHDSLSKEQSLYRRTSRTLPGALAASVAEHRLIFAALKACDPVEAEQAMLRHVQRGKARLIEAAELEENPLVTRQGARRRNALPSGRSSAMGKV